ncbi:NADH-quinone oxidoreductase subunit M [Myxococcota bacterium]|nr:NADH-quinone oxidoreductase subunit M [Myxococcota bacterium]
MDMLSNAPILSVLWIWPAALALVILTLRSPRWSLPLSLAGLAVELGLSAGVLATFSHAESGLQFEELGPALGPVSLHLGVDGLSVLFLPVAALLALLMTVYAQLVKKERADRWAACVLGLLSTLMLRICAVDLSVFWVASAVELPLVLTLLRGWGAGARRDEAAARAARFLGLSLVLFAVGAVMLAADHAVRVGVWTFDAAELELNPSGGRVGMVAFTLLFQALALRAPLFPWHGWLSDVVAEGPLVGLNVFLLGVKIGTLGMLRFVLPLAPDAAAAWAPALSVIAGAGIVYGSLLALVQPDLRRVLAYAAVAHSGVVVLGLFSLNHAGLEGAILEMLNFGVAIAGLYFVTGFLQARVGEVAMHRLGGLWAVAPRLSFAFLVVTLAGIGMPGTSGFDALHLLIDGAAEAHHYGVALGLGLGTVLIAGVLLGAYQRAFLAPTQETLPSGMLDLRPAEIGIAGVLCALIFAVGLNAHPWLDTMTRSVERVSAEVDPLEHEEEVDDHDDNNDHDHDEDDEVGTPSPSHTEVAP